MCQCCCILNVQEVQLPKGTATLWVLPNGNVLHVCENFTDRFGYGGSADHGFRILSNMHGPCISATCVMSVPFCRPRRPGWGICAKAGHQRRQAARGVSVALAAGRVKPKSIQGGCTTYCHLPARSALGQARMAVASSQQKALVKTATQKSVGAASMHLGSLYSHGAVGKRSSVPNTSGMSRAQSVPVGVGDDFGVMQPLGGSSTATFEVHTGHLLW